MLELDSGTYIEGSGDRRDTTVEPAELILIGVLALTNLVAGIGIAVPLATQLTRVTHRPDRVARYSGAIVGVYLLECVAFPAGMATQFLSVGLAFVWGLVFGLWLRNCAPATTILRWVVALALYTTVPTVSFAVIVPFAWMIAGNSIVTAAGGHQFGIPPFVPGPLNTVLGFAVALLVGTVVLKTVITAGAVSLLLHFRQRASVAPDTAAEPIAPAARPPVH